METAEMEDQMRRVGLAVVLATLAGAASAQSAPRSKDEFCREILDLVGDLITQTATVMMATGLEGFEETGEPVASDPRVEESVSTLTDTAIGVAEKLTAYCRE